MNLKFKTLTFAVLLLALNANFANAASSKDKKNEFSKEDIENRKPGWEEEDIELSDYSVNSYKNSFSSTERETEENTSKNKSNKKQTNKNSNTKKQSTKKNNSSEEDEAVFEQIISENAKNKIVHMQNIEGTAMQWAQLNDNKWMLLSGSEILTGWQFVYGTWYYMDYDGIMQNGWICPNGTWYYLDNSGAMLYDTYVNGYYLDSTGAWI